MTTFYNCQGSVCALLILAIFLFRTPIYAQPTLTQSNTGYQVGGKISYYLTAGLPAGNAGSNQSWSFPSLGYTRTFTGIISDCNSSAGCPDHPGSTMVNSGPDISYFIKADADSTVLMGTSSFNEVYSNPQLLLKFPFTYGDKYVDSFRSSEHNGHSSYVHIGSDSTEANAWGNITINTGISGNVLRIKKTLTYQDIYDTGTGPIVFHYKVLQYQWYMPGYHEYLLSTTTINCDFPGVPAVRTEARFTAMPGNPTSVAAISQRVSLLENPVNRIVRFRVNTSSTGTIYCSITDALGKQVAQRSYPSLGNSLDLEIHVDDWARGTYFLSVWDNQEKVTKRFIVE